MTNEELQIKIIEWAAAKNLIKPENALKQYAKFQSEAGELADAILSNNRDETVDAIGDVQVTLIILCAQMGLDYNECLKSAYNEIKDRTGETINGVFIKRGVLREG